MPDEIIIREETPTAEAVESAVSEAVEIAQTIVDEAQRMERSGEISADQFESVMREVRDLRAENAATHATILERLSQIETAVVISAAVVEDAVVEAIEESEESPIEEAAEEAVEEIIEEVAQETATENLEVQRDEPEKRSRKRYMI